MIGRERFIGRQVEPLVRVPRTIKEMNRRADQLAAELAALEDKVRSIENLRAYESVDRSLGRSETAVTIDSGDILASNFDSRFDTKKRSELERIQRSRQERRL